MNNLEIKRYEDKYSDEVTSILQEKFTIEGEIQLEDSENSFSIIALINNKVVGHVRVDKLKNIGKNCYYYLINYVCVADNYQNRNIATEMLTYLFDYAKKDCVSYLELTSKATREAANHLYLKNGFTIKETNVFVKNI